MEFRINKVDTDLRDKLKEEIKTDKIHGNNYISIKKDLKKDENKDKNDSENKEEIKKFFKKYITIDGIKYNAKKSYVNVEKVEKLNEINSKGRFLDIEK
ncbi:hypothetical protein ACTFIN_05010 [Clostridium cagae]|uniref:Uncharacterized protein n=1 Tax=Clostridium botulinum (strain Eklund 17B / Type B) TaxID=935198 RepID=B2TLR9_CLOBB|nr:MULTISPECIES: hypothetical protein [unclassified Clostridium]ACD24874.1 conserved hypothetical protein [Clostridium botulinum B str. Eklund 17B (NRP)]MBN1051145.1 hypothetical protein [Clostridium botulinum]MBN1054435.1 hypothetical protein [Clostridium botulinum]MBY6976682.1 hypothetical protein [Clostridium botulinum]MBY7001385.1 hypothetical protein [Clostridium botulinum]